jgi:DNA polymerase-3 subunit gamma/tau
VKDRRRVTWIQLSQHAQAVGLDGRTLTVGFNNAGARESFVNGRSDLILQQVIIDLVGQDWKVEAIVDPSAQPGRSQPAAPATGPRWSGEPAPTTPVTEHRPDPRSESRPDPRPDAANPPDEPPAWAVGPTPGEPEPEPVHRSAGARDAIRQTRPAGAGRAAADSPATGGRDADEDADRDDPEIEALDGTQLLTQRLGAQVIEEIPHG